MSDLESHDPGDPVEPTTDPSSIDGQPSEPAGRRIVTLMPDLGREPSASVSASAAETAWAAATAPWHPAILARLDRLPVLENAASPTGPSSSDFLILPPDDAELSSGFLAEAERAGIPLIRATSDRAALSRQIGQAIDPDGLTDPPEDPFVLDFHALGLGRWWLGELTAAMQHVDCLDHASFERETLAGARAWAADDRPGARNRLRAAFELLTEARERFYPVDAYILDLLLLDASDSASTLPQILVDRIPFTLLATAQAIETLAQRDPETVKALENAINEGWADVIGGPYQETEEPLLPLTSVLWQFRRGAEVYRKHLDDRTVETLASRRFALYPARPEIAKRHGFRFALHFGLDSGVFPIPPESKRLWESPDGSNLESLTRVPIAADRIQEAVRLPWRLGRGMRDDQAAILTLVHWPSQVAPWFLDFRRIATYSPVFARWVTVGDFFHLSDRPFDIFRPSLDEYQFPYLEQAARAANPSPISSTIHHARLRARLDGASTVAALANALETVFPRADLPTIPNPASIDECEQRVESEGLASEPTLIAMEHETAEALAHRLGDVHASESGLLVLNPTGLARRVPVKLPMDAPIPDVSGPVHASQLVEDGVVAVVTLPPLGYAWIPTAPSSVGTSLGGGGASAHGPLLRNEFAQLDIDTKTGGLRGIRALDDDSARLGQQLVFVGPAWRGADGKAAATRMICQSYEPAYGGPAMAEGISKGQILDPTGEHVLARFTQTFRLWSGRPLAEIRIEIDEIDSDIERVLECNAPWECYLACRWAWPDSQATLRRTHFLGPCSTTVDRPETAEALEITTRRQRTAILMGGLAHHQRYGTRMVDTILVAGAERHRKFEMALALDLEHPFQAILDQVGPAPLVTIGLSPTHPRSGWLYRVDAQNVAILRAQIPPPVEDGPGPTIVLDLLETMGRSTRARLHGFANPIQARQTDLNGELVVDLSVDGDSVLLDLTPHELARIEIRLA